MLDSLPVSLLVGTVLGFMSGLGLGGGSLLMLWLTVVLKTDPQVARTVNQLFFVPSALISCIVRAKSGELNIRPLLPATLSGCLAAIIASLLSKIVNTAILRKLLGLILIAAGTRELFYGKKKGSSK